jgi:hypothetical protein
MVAGLAALSAAALSTGGCPQFVTILWTDSEQKLALATVSNLPCSLHHRPVPQELPFYDKMQGLGLAAPAGSLFLWDSRTAHQNQGPKSTTDWRHVVYCCYQPRHVHPLLPEPGSWFAALMCFSHESRSHEPSRFGVAGTQGLKFVPLPYPAAEPWPRPKTLS